ncbi:E3 ubiquitin-protein ligase Topors isoform X3 [Eucalyptus grandis]|uniref:E3 ubiquitin-protein ligase Topors isoform X3 n=1 Tax=Eucalyptus grandis TaxID=71139 RepID=UPI00192EE5CA|nr:E3 ubiquitin-protein ligase Topors isoform X3 [Eucalyptus grandis]
MESTSSPSSSSPSRKRAFSPSHRRREKFLSRAIPPPVRGQSCPICLETIEDGRRGAAAVLPTCLHAYCLDCIRRWSRLRRRCPLCNAGFGSWFRHTGLRRKGFLEERLPPADGDGEARRRAGSAPLVRRRTIRISRDELNGSTQQTRPDPWRRSFGRPGSVPADVVAARKLQWRASIYNRLLQAVPSSRNSQGLPRGSGWKERILRRIEPWTRRELEAILGDPDPSVIVHVVTSVFISTFEKKQNVPHGQLGEDVVASLWPFLHDRTHMFWHELRFVITS